MLKGGDKPQEKTMWEATIASQDKKAPEQIGFLYNVIDTPTIDVYVNPSEGVFLVSVRGTYDMRDVRADATLAFNALRFSKRQRGDVAVIRQIIRKYPPQKQDYYLTGHSLGGAVIRQLKRDFPFFKDSTVYNGAFQPFDLVSQQSGATASRQVNNDPLQVLGGRYFSNKLVVPNITGKKTKSWGRKIISGHDLENFAPLY